MRKFWRVIKWSVLGLGLVFVFVVVGLAIYTRTESFAQWAREQAIAAANGSMRGTISLERLEGSVWHQLTLHNVELRYEGTELVQVPRLELSYSLLPLIWGRFQISRIDALQPRAHLRQDQQGRWNVVEALSPRQPEPETKSDLIVLVKSLRLRDANVDLRLASGGDETLHLLKNLNLEGNVGIRPSGVALEINEVAAGLVSPGQPELNLKGALEYQQSTAVPTLLKVKNLWAVSRNSRVKLNGQIAHRDGEPLKIKAQAALDKLAPADVAYFVAGWPLKRDLAGNLSIDGALDDLKGNLDLTGAGAKIAGKFRADLAQDLPRYTMSATVSGFDLRQWLEDRNLAGVVGATVEANGTGFALQNTGASARVEVRSTVVQGWTLGDVSMEGRLQKSVAAFDGRLKSKLGGANGSGKVGFGGKRPTYDLALSVKDLDIQKALPDGKAVEGKLNLQGTVKGSGFTPADMNTRAEVQILPSTVGPVAVKQGALNATLSDKKIRISRASLTAAESTLSASGEFGVDVKTVGKLDYQFRAADVGPWLSLVSKKGSGSVDLAGQAQGNLADLHTQGTVRLSGLRLEGISVKNGDVKFAVRTAKDQSLPQGIVTAHLTEIDAGVAFRRIDATTKLSGQKSDSVQFDIGAQDSQERKHAVSGTLSYSPEVIMVRLSEAALASPDGSWKLLRPATVTKRGDAFSIEQFSMKNGAKELSLNGRFAFAGQQDLTLNVDRLPIETLTAFFPQQTKMSGLLGVQARIAGTAAAPEISAAARLSEPMIEGQAYQGASADLDYKSKQASLRLAVQQDSTHALNGSGTIPINLSWHNGFRAEAADGMDLRVQSSGVSLRFLNAFSGKSVEKIAGEVSLDVRARGSVKQPDLRGMFRLSDGNARIVPLGVDINAIAAAGSLDSRSVTVREISARAKDGEIKGSGSLALKSDYDIGGFKLSLTAQRWPAIETQRYQLKIAGNLDVQGTLAAPKVTGQVTATEGSLRPDLAFLEQSKVPLKRDETIVIVKNNGAAGQPVSQAQQRAGSTDDGFFKNASLDLMLQAPGNVWIRHPDLVSELSGNIRATKRPERDIDLTGRIDTVRGWLNFQGRRFQLTRGTIQFTGGDKINPALDIVAQYRLPEYQVDVAIGGTTEKPSLTLASQPRLEQADILALLLFGRPINALSRNEQGSLQQSAMNITSGYVAGKIASSVSGALGLDSLGVDIREVDFSGGKVGFGRYVGSKTYVSASQQVTGEHGRELSMEYEITPDWKLGTTTTSKGANGIDIIWHKRY
jgi:autotransporter translocation and assembly factor TamB